MAKGIVDCTGKVINIGDKVRTASGDVIEIQGGFISERKFFNAAGCKVVPKHTKLTNSGKAIDCVKQFNDASGTPQAAAALNDGGDCIVWGN